MSAAGRLAQAMRPMDVQARHALAEALGLPRVVVARAACGRSTNPDAYVSICAAIGFDPLKDRGIAPQKPLHLTVDWTLLGMAVCIKRRRIDKLSQRDAAAVADATATAFCRVEQARPVSAENLLKICRFLGVSPLGCAFVSQKHQCNTLESQEVGAPA